MKHDDDVNSQQPQQCEAVQKSATHASALGGQFPLSTANSLSLSL